LKSQNEAELASPVTDSSDNNVRVWGVSVDSQWQSLLLRIGTGMLVLKKAPAVQPLIDALLQVNTPEANVLASELGNHGRRISYYVMAARYETGPWQSRLSIIRTKSESVPLPAADLGLIGIGYRVSSFTPFVMMSAVSGTSKIYSTGLPETSENAALNDLVYSVQSAGNFKQSTVSVGVRYDFAPKMDFKFQIDRARLHDSHLMIGSEPGRGEHLNMTILGAAFDFVF
jgi:hypothetical protein